MPRAALVAAVLALLVGVTFWLAPDPASRADGRSVALAGPTAPAGRGPAGRGPDPRPSAPGSPEAAAAIEPLAVPEVDPLAPLAWLPERLPAEALALAEGDDPVLRLEEVLVDCEGPPLVRLLAAHADGRVVETSHRGTASAPELTRHERRVDPARLLALLTELNDAGFFAVRLDPREQLLKEALLPEGAHLDDGPESRTSSLAVRLPSATYSATGTNLSGHVRRLPGFVELAALDRAVTRVGEVLAPAPR